MKKIKSILLILCLFLFPSVIVNASGEAISISCPSSAKAGETISCKVVGNAGTGSISSLEAKISISDNLEIVKFTTASIWEGNASNGSIDLYTDVNKTDVFDIGVFQIKVKDYNASSDSVLLHDVIYYDDSFNDISIENTSSTIKIVSTNNYLASLSLSNGKLSPSFNKSTTSYKATIDSDKVTISATSEDQKAVVKGTGVKNLSYGKNTFTVSVTSESGAVKKYSIVITRPDNREKEEEEKIESNNTTSTVVLSGDNKLKSLEIDGYDIKFKANTLKYSIDVEDNVNSLKVKSVANDSKAKVIVVGNDKIISGKNEITVSVIAENGDTLEYVITVNKEIVSQVLLKSLEIEDYEIDFDAEKFEYELEIKDDDMLNIQAVPSIEDAKVTIENNGSLKNNSIIEIKVSYKESESIYKIHIKKEEIEEEPEEYSDNDKAKLTVLTILGVLLIIVSVSGLVFNIINSIKNKKHGNI